MAFLLLYFDLDKFRANFKHLNSEQMEIVLLFIDRDLRNLDSTDPKEGSSKALGKGLFELRMQRNPDLLVRIFWTYGNAGEIVILDGYDKKKDSSKLTQQRHISRSRSRLDAVRNGD